MKYIVCECESTATLKTNTAINEGPGDSMN